MSIRQEIALANSLAKTHRQYKQITLESQVLYNQNYELIRFMLGNKSWQYRFEKQILQRMHSS